MTLVAASDLLSIAERFGDNCPVDSSICCKDLSMFCIIDPRLPQDSPCQHNRNDNSFFQCRTNFKHCIQLISKFQGIL